MAVELSARSRVASIAGMGPFIQRLTFVVGVVLMLGCSHTQRMTTSEVVRLAGTAATAAGFRLSDYREPDVRWELADRNRTWTVFYEGKVLLPGHHFLIVIDDQTGSTLVMRGQ